MNTERFAHSFRYAALTDVGRQRKSNQDETFCAAGTGFFGVSDGMGGLQSGGAAAAYVKEAMPLLAQGCAGDWTANRRSPEQVGQQLADCAQMLSDRLFEQGNTERFFRFGATLAAVQLYGDSAVFVWLGDSRGYILRKYRKLPEQLTEDMNVANYLVKAGEMSREEALGSPESSRLTAFVGMPAPAAPAFRVAPVGPGDRILLCSDGLYGLVPEREIARLLRSSRSPERVCRRLIDAANAHGGRDNISAVYICIR